MTRRKILIASLVTLAMGVVAAPPAAAEVSGGTFDCTGYFFEWPRAGVTTCTGTARGVFREGPATVVCVPACAYEMTIDYDPTCIGSDPGMIGTFVGNITITNGDTFETPYAATYVMPDVPITTSSPVGAGDAALLPLTPIATCTAPGPWSFELTGALAFD